MGTFLDLKANSPRGLSEPTEEDTREHPDMMSASEGGGGSWKSGRSKGGCVNFILQISSKCGQGGEGGSKNLKILRMSLMEAPLLCSQRADPLLPNNWMQRIRRRFLSAFK